MFGSIIPPHENKENHQLYVALRAALNNKFHRKQEKTKNAHFNTERKKNRLNNNTDTFAASREWNVNRNIVKTNAKPPTPFYSLEIGKTPKHSIITFLRPVQAWTYAAKCKENNNSLALHIAKSS